MSRSVRKSPVITDGQTGKAAKRRQKFKKKSQKAVRAVEDISNGNSYKKEYCSWNIQDYKCHNWNNRETPNVPKRKWTNK